MLRFWVLGPWGIVFLATIVDWRTKIAWFWRFVLINWTLAFATYAAALSLGFPSGIIWKQPEDVKHSRNGLEHWSASNLLINEITRFLLFMKFERFTQSLCYTELWLCNIDNIGSTYHLYKRQGYLVNVISNKDGHYSSNTRCFYSSNKSYDHTPGFTYVSFPTWLPVVPESLPAGTWNWNS
jgi:hypothetical protein